MGAAPHHELRRLLFSRFLSEGSAGSGILQRTGSAPPHLDEEDTSGSFSHCGPSLALLGSHPAGMSCSSPFGTDPDGRAACSDLAMRGLSGGTRLGDHLRNCDTIRAHWGDTGANCKQGPASDEHDLSLEAVLSCRLSLQDTDDVDVAGTLSQGGSPGPYMGLSCSPGAVETLHSWPASGNARVSQDAELPFFNGKAIKTGGLGSVHSVPRAASLSGLAHGGGNRDGSFGGGEALFGTSPGSAPITPRSASLFGDLLPHAMDSPLALADSPSAPAVQFGSLPQDAGFGLQQVGGRGCDRHKPSKLRMSSTEMAYEALAAAAHPLTQQVGDAAPFQPAPCAPQHASRGVASDSPLARQRGASQQDSRAAAAQAAAVHDAAHAAVQAAAVAQVAAAQEAAQAAMAAAAAAAAQQQQQQQSAGHAGARAGVTPLAPGGLTAGSGGVAPNPQQLQALAMAAAAAAIYPYYSQPAAAAFASPVAPLVAPSPFGAAFPMPGFQTALAAAGGGGGAPAGADVVAAQQAALALSPFLAAPEYASYYQGLLQMQAAAMQRMGGPASAMAIATAAAAAAAAAAAGAHEALDGCSDASARARGAPSADASRTAAAAAPARGGGGGGGGGGERPAARRGSDRPPSGRSAREDSASRLDPLLEDFKAGRARKLEMRDVLGHMMGFSLDQHGSRFIQQRLGTLTPAELDAAFAEVAPRTLTLMSDVFGNYVVQKLLELGTHAHRTALCEQLQGQVLGLSLQMYGCRVVQKALEVCTLEQARTIAAELEAHVMRCVRDQNGNHVIQKVVERVPSEHIPRILDTCLGQVVALSMHPFGCRVVQRILEHCSDARRYEAVMSEVLQAVVVLAQDQYGNYVVQHVIQSGTPSERAAAVAQLAPQVVALSQHKFASNVVEKMLLHAAAAERAAIVARMLTEVAPGEPEPLQQMMRDQFGNYVVQKLLEVCDDQQRDVLMGRVRTHLSSLRKYTYGKHIAMRIEKALSSSGGGGRCAGIGGAGAPLHDGSDSDVPGPSGGGGMGAGGGDQGPGPQPGGAAAAHAAWSAGG